MPMAFLNKKRIVGVRSVEQFVWHLFAPNIIKIVSVNFGGNRMQYKGFTKQARKAMRLAENLAEKEQQTQMGSEYLPGRAFFLWKDME